MGNTIPILDNATVTSDTAARVNAGYETEAEAQRKSPLDADFDRMMEKTLEDWHIQGMSVAIVDGEQTWSEVPYERIT
jgi:hypothetical protein